MVSVTAELPLVLAAVALALVAALLSLPRRADPLRVRAAVVCALIAGVAPLLLAPAMDAARAGGRGLWEWSAVGGPTIQASYRFDGIAAIGVTVGVGYACAGLFAVARVGDRHPLLPAIVLGTGFVFIALAVTEDLIADTVVLGVLGALTTIAALLVAPAQATARLAAYLMIGIQGFVVSALLLARLGAFSFRFDAIPPTSVSPGAILAATVAAALFCGLYPFVPWRFERPATRHAQRDLLRGIVAMPAGIGATLVLLRLLGVTRADLSTIGLPSIPAEVRAIGIAIALGTIVLVPGDRGARSRRAIAAALAGAALLAYPAMHWSHLVLIAVLLTVGYAAAVSLSDPQRWDVVRYDVTLATIWIALALGTPTAIAGALILAVADAALAGAEALWLDPARSYIALAAGATLSTAAILTIAVGTNAASDPLTVGLAAVALAAVLALDLVHASRRLGFADAPRELDLTAAAAGFLVTVLAAILLAFPLYAGVTATLGRPFAPSARSAPTALPVIAAIATMLVFASRAVRPFVPDLAPFGDRLRVVVSILDPVPAGIATFRIIDTGASWASAILGALERRGGVWLATLLIAALLVWSVR